MSFYKLMPFNNWFPQAGLHSNYRSFSAGDIDSWRRITSGDLGKIETPIIFNDVNFKKQPKHVLSTMPGGPAIISEELCSHLKNNDITGWNTFDIVLENNFGIKYFGMVITGRIGKAEVPNLNNIVQERANPKDPTLPISTWYKGITLHLDTWDQSDIFLHAVSGYVFYTETAKSSFIEYGVPKTGFMNIDDLLFPTEWYEDKT